MDQAIKLAAHAADAGHAKVHGGVSSIEPRKDAAAKPDDDLKAAVADLHERVAKLEARLEAQIKATAHITAIQPIKGLGS